MHLLAQRRQATAVGDPGFRHNDESLVGGIFLSAGEYRHATFANALQFADGLFQLLRINIAPRADNQIFATPGV
jgi:hypothetical protein